MLLVHAHPDDETINNGATMAKYVAEGAQVTLVTCTRGEEGEVLVPELAHLAAADGDGLGPHREGELAAAMAVLGVTDHRFLGGPGRFRDTGMLYDESGAATKPETIRPDTFWSADLLEAADLLVSIIREIRPQVLVTYDEHGGYGHPDHVQAHRVATYATSLAAAPSYRIDLGAPWAVQKVYWSASPRSVMAEALELAKKAGINFFDMESVEDLPFLIDDELVTTKVTARQHYDQKMAALRAHATQITEDGPFFALAGLDGSNAFADEYYRLVQGRAVRDAGDSLETDLFAGVQLDDDRLGDSDAVPPAQHQRMAEVSGDDAGSEAASAATTGAESRAANGTAKVATEGASVARNEGVARAVG